MSTSIGNDSCGWEVFRGRRLNQHGWYVEIFTPQWPVESMINSWNYTDRNIRTCRWSRHVM